MNLIRLTLENNNSYSYFTFLISYDLYYRNLNQVHINLELKNIIN